MTTTISPTKDDAVDTGCNLVESVTTQDRTTALPLEDREGLWEAQCRCKPLRILKRAERKVASLIGKLKMKMPGCWALKGSVWRDDEERLASI